MLRIQRSIPLPRVRIERIINYIDKVGDAGGIKCWELKGKGLDFGRGKGDITRFLALVNLVKVSEDCTVELTELGSLVKRALSSSAEAAKALLKLILYRELPHFRVLVNLVHEIGQIDQRALFDELNKKMATLSPTSWVNEVAFKSLLGLAADLGALEIEGGRVRPRELPSGFWGCLETSSLRIGKDVVFSIEELAHCLTNALTLKVSPEALANTVGKGDCVEPMVAPGPKGPRKSYFKVINKDCVVLQLINALVESLMGNNEAMATK